MTGMDTSVARAGVQVHVWLAEAACRSVPQPVLSRDLYAGQRFTVTAGPITDADVDEEIASARDYLATWHTVDRPAMNGDMAVIDLATTVDGVPASTGQARDLSYIIGGLLIPALDLALVGAAHGASLTTPAATERGDTAEVTVTVHEVREKRLPALDDAFAVALGTRYGTRAANLTDALEQVRRYLGEQRLAEQRREVLDQLADLAHCQYPADRAMRDEIRATAKRTIGPHPERVAERNGLSTEAFIAQAHLSATRAVRLRWLLDQVALLEHLPQPTPEAVMDQVKAVAAAEQLAVDATVRALIGNKRMTAVVADLVRASAATALLGQIEVLDPQGNEITWN